MPIFSVCTINEENDEPIGARISSGFPDEFYDIGRGQWLIRFSGTAQQLYKKLFPEDKFPFPSKGVTIFGIAGYYGNASRDMWEWIATKLLLEQV